MSGEPPFDADSQVGRKVGPYRILERLGAGGMGEVYLGRDTRLDRDVALKRIRPEPTLSEERARRFRAEAKIAAGLSHPRIVQIFDVLEDEDSWIVMEHVEGRTLAQYLRARTTPEAPFLPIPEVLDIGIQIADGLAAAHARAVLHRDLKLETC